MGTGMTEMMPKRPTPHTARIIRRLMVVLFQIIVLGVQHNIRAGGAQTWLVGG